MRNVDSTWNIIDLLERFDRGATLSTRQVADSYGVHIRTAQRWINEIDEHRGLECVSPAMSWQPALWRMKR